MRYTYAALACSLFLLAGCEPADHPEPDQERPADVAAERRGPATAIGSGRPELSPDELEAGRHDDSWRRYVRPADRPTGGETGEGDPTDESWEDISADRVNAAPALPLVGDVAGPSVTRVQILLDQARFSPGIIDGRWGKNTEKAVHWFQDANGLPATGEVDRSTLDALERAAGGQAVRAHRLTEADVEGPFVDIPDDIYERAELDCLCYESLREKLGEVFHSSPELLEQLNPGVDLNGLASGDELTVPAVEPFRVGELPDGENGGSGEVDRIVVSVGGHYLHALDANGRILYHFPTTLGEEYSPAAGEEWIVEAIAFRPEWHYQPELLRDVDPEDEDAIIPAGPNNDVGIVWMALSKPHYGIHGTKAPETIGYAVSSGCVRLTNWDAAFLARRVAEGVTVEFIDVEGR